MNTIEPTPSKQANKDVEEATETVVLERDAAFDQDRKTAAPWSEVRQRILSQPLPR